MKLFKYILPLFLIVCFLTPIFLLADEIVIAADYWCPINCDAGNNNPGILIEIADTIFSQKNFTITYIQMPWKRAFAMAREGKVNAIVGAFYGDAPDFIFPENEQISLTNSFDVLRENDWNFTGLESLKNVKLGYINGYDYGELVNNYIKTAAKDNVLMISGESNLTDRLMSLLIVNRLDVIVETNLVFLYQSQQNGNASLFRHAGNASEPMKAYIAFSPKLPTSKKYAKILSDGMIEIKESGQLEKIIRKYNLNP